AKDMFRPIARKYDENEHEYPKELDVLRPPVPKKPAEGVEKRVEVVKEIDRFGKELLALCRDVPFPDFCRPSIQEALDVCSAFTKDGWLPALVALSRPREDND
ncbi:MAG: hypothetical protein JRF33_27930, partial [Deltaproteobacteria bacterium]|nr:hypothetical protein [Deltaproteobacteria bacterium]